MMTDLAQTADPPCYNSGEQLQCSNGEGVRVVAMCTFEAMQDYELGFRQYDVLTAVAKAHEDPSWWVGQTGGKIGLFPSECVEVLKGDTDTLPLFRIFLNEDGEDGDNETGNLMERVESDPTLRASLSSDFVRDIAGPIITDEAEAVAALCMSTSSTITTSSSTSSLHNDRRSVMEEVDVNYQSRQQRAHTEPNADVALVSCYRCRKEVSIRREQSFYPCECGANVKRPDAEADADSNQAAGDADSGANEASQLAIVRPRRNTTASIVQQQTVAVRKTSKKQERKVKKEKKKEKKQDKKQRELKKKQEEEERRFREKREKGRLTDSHWNKRVDSARERLWRASLLVENGSQVIAAEEGFALDVSNTIRNSNKISKEESKTESTKAQKKKKQQKEEKKLLKEQKKQEKREEKKRRNSLSNSRGSLFTTASRKKDKVVTASIPSGKQQQDEEEEVRKMPPIVRTKSGRVMKLEDIEREGKKSNWDVSRLFSVRIAGRGGSSKKSRAETSASSAHGKQSNPNQLKRTKSTSALSIGRSGAKQQQQQSAYADLERQKLEEAARKLEEERRLFAEERERFERERLKLMIALAQEMEDVKIARDGTPMYPSPSTVTNPDYVSPAQPLSMVTPDLAARPASHYQPLPLSPNDSGNTATVALVPATMASEANGRGAGVLMPLELFPTSPSPMASFVTSQSLFTSLPSAPEAGVLNDPTVAAAASLSPSPKTSQSTPSLPPYADLMTGNSVPLPSPSAIYNPSLAAFPTSVCSGQEENAKPLPSPRKPPAGGVLLPFFKSAPLSPRNYAAAADSCVESEEVLLSSADLLSSSSGHHVIRQQPKSDDDEDDDSHREDDNHADDGQEEWERSSEEDNVDSETESLEYITPCDNILDAVMSHDYDTKRDKHCERANNRKITVVPIVGIAEMKALDAQAEDTDDDELSNKTDSSSSWLLAVSPRERQRRAQAEHEVMKQQQQQQQQKEKQADLNRHIRDSKDMIVRPGAKAPDTNTSSSKKVSFGSQPSWVTADSPRRKLEALRAMGMSQADILMHEEQQQQHAEKHHSGYDSTEVEEEKDEEKLHSLPGEQEEEEIVKVPEWTRGPPRSLQEMREYKEFVRQRYEAEKLLAERMLQHSKRARGITG